MRIALWSMFFLVCSSVIGAEVSLSEIEKLPHNLKLIEECFDGPYFNRDAFDKARNDPYFKEQIADSEEMQSMLERIDGLRPVTKTAFYDALIEEWFLQALYPAMVAGELSEDGHDLKSDFLRFAVERTMYEIVGH